MAEQIRAKKLSPVELVQAHIERISELNLKINAFIHIAAERAFEQAQAAEAAVMRNANLGPLHGVPISIKSSISVAGMPYEAGTKLRAGVVGETDAPLVTRLRNAGAIIIASITC